MGRESLRRTLQSIQEQTAQSWEAVLVPDISKTSVEEVGEYATDLRILLAPGYSEAAGSAGQLRNRGLPYCSGEWIAFVDDDDHLKPTYIEHLAEHAADFPQAEVIIFRMDDPRWGILPRPNSALLKRGLVGISFAVKRATMLSFEFVREMPGDRFHEDIIMIDELRANGHEIYISPHVDYLVREAVHA